MSVTNNEAQVQVQAQVPHEELYKWVDCHEISRPKRNLNRDFSDAVAMAELLKSHWPRLVELHNYAPRSSLARKLDNWTTLNRKVLAKIGLRLSGPELEGVARGQPGAVEQLLERVRRKVEVRQCPAEPRQLPAEQQPLVPAELLERQQLELDIKDEAIELLGEKVKHLQNLLQLKDQRIDELTAKLDHCIADTHNANNSFFKIF